ncbi:hypothetical protein [Curtobacterium sp. MEB011]|uniref:hypothetical protein n=1 Tax=Curtobacterium sp. MEB011 TaxID=3040285 RepID=UPI00254F8F34|nr:hypothetical protein [Curtobacterium sp. MEB011]
MSRVVDTNVLLICRNPEDWPAELRDACDELIEAVLEKRLEIVVDDGGEILEEYMHQLSLSGQPSLGDEFLKYVHDYQYSWHLKYRPNIRPNSSESNSYGVLGGDDAEIDPSDRKFIAAAKVAKTPIFQASDTKWLNWQGVLSRHGVEVRFVHEDSIRRAYAKKFKMEAPIWTS